MSNPYSSVTVSNYNDNAPSNDGSRTSQNQLNWNTHKTKLGDPLKTAIEAINTNVLAAFSRVLGAQNTTKSANYTVAATDQGSVIAVDTGGVTISLEEASNYGNNFAVLIFNTSETGYVRIATGGSDNINGLFSALNLAPNGWIMLTSLSGTGWIAAIDYGEYRLVKAADTSRSATSTLADDTELAAFSLPGGAFYEVDGVLVFGSASATPDAKIAMQFSSAPNEREFMILQHDGASTFAGSQSPLSSAVAVPISAGNKAVVHLKGRIYTQAAATLDLQWAQNTSDGTAVVLERGSYLALRPFPA